MKNRPLRRITFSLFLVSIMVMIALAGCGMQPRKGATDNHRGLNNQTYPYDNNNRIGNRNMHPNSAANPLPTHDGVRNNANKHGVDGVIDGGRFNANSKMEMSQKIADSVASLGEVESANVLITGNNAYVAVRLKHNSGVAPSATNNNAHKANEAENIAPEIKNKIADKVKATDGNIKDVYVSANPDFVERMNVYANDFREGRPLTGIFKEFGTMVERIFPTHLTP